jgi:hypothetical protein
VVPIPSITVPKNALAFGAGAVYYAPLGTSAPANTGVGSVFTDVWPAGWTPIGITKAGHTLNINVDTDAVDAAEYADHLLNVVTGRTITSEMELMQIHLTNYSRAFNGGVKTTSGSGTTLVTTYTLPAIGTEVRCQIGWESTDGTERWWMMQAFQTGNVGIDRKKGADNATLPLVWTAEPDSNLQPVYFASASPIRG